MTLQASGAISLFDVNTELGLTRTSQIGMLCSSVRTLFSDASGAVAMFDGYGKSNTSVPGAPTGVSASATSSSAISVSFSAPASNGGLSIDYYQAVCTATGSHSATGTSPISVTGLCPSTSYTFKVRAHNSKGYGCYSSSTGTATTSTPTGCQAYTTNGCYTWVVPAGVNSFSALTVGAGAPGQKHTSYTCCCSGQTGYAGGFGGAGGGNAHINNKSTTPGTSWTVTVSASAPCGYGLSAVQRPGYNAAVMAYNGGANDGPGQSGGGGYYSCGCIAVGNKGGGGGYWTQWRCGLATQGGGGGGGGAGGYAGGQANSNYSRGGDSSKFCGWAGRCGGGGGGSLGTQCSCGCGYGGGGVGIYGQGSSGSGGSYPHGAGHGGSGGNCGSGYSGGSYGGGSGGGGQLTNSNAYIHGYSQGAVRIKWGSSF